VGRRHILITGAASGIGAACARQLACTKSLLCLHTGKNIKKLEKLAAELAHTATAEIMCFSADFSSPEQTRRLTAELRAQAGFIDQLVLNAGYAEKTDLKNTTPEQLDTAFAVMARQPAGLINAFLPDIMASACGRIVSVSSFVNKSRGVNDTYFTATAVAKGALESLTMAAARQMRDSRATANIISPGYTRKDGDKSALTQEEWQQLAARLPLGRLVEPDEVAALICYLLSEQAAMITGQIIAVDSGLSLL